LEGGDHSDRSALLGKNTNKFALDEMKRYCEYIPQVEVEYYLKPIAQTILKVDLSIKPQWRFNPKWHLKS
jgi:activating signal cointegrator complex subunit 3